jgi:hypothetical protein
MTSVTVWMDDKRIGRLDFPDDSFPLPGSKEHPLILEWGERKIPYLLMMQRKGDG